jgi:hypothetical protein
MTDVVRLNLNAMIVALLVAASAINGLAVYAHL